jgi:phosphoglycerol transferase MdoB-like AlkP superfamily enzyme
LAGAAVLFAVPVIAAWAPRIGRTGFHAASLTGALASLFSRLDVDPGAYRDLTADSLVAVYRTLTRTGPGAGPGTLTGRARGHDVMLVVMETVPARCLDLSGPLEDLPHLKRLRERALVATRHHTTFPFTSYALFSLLTSWYPSLGPRSFVHRYAGAQVPGLMGAARRQGYRAVVYAPDRSWFERDQLMYSMVGVERLGLPERRLGRQDVEVLDRRAHAALLRDVRGWIAASQRYAIGFFPQTTHGPWKGEAAEALLTRCRRLVGRVDGWLGEVLDTLARTGRLERTLILVTGDHGVRTFQEDPDFRAGALDAYSYHVPLLLYAPGVVDRTVWVRHLTSHLDVTPTILDLLGIAEGRSYELGMTMDDPRAANRVVFLLGATFLGTDGYHDNGRFVALNRVTNTLYVTRDSLSFTAEDVVAEAARATRDSLVRPLRELNALQEAMAARVLGGRARP